MFTLFSRLCTLIGFLVVCAVGIFYARDPLVNWTLCWLVRQSTTFECQIDQVNVDATWPTRVHLRGMTIKNPSDFADPIALEIPAATFYLTSDPWENQQLNFRLVDLEIDRLNLVNSEPGANNLTRFLAVAQRTSDQHSAFNFESLQLRVTDPHYFGLHRYRLVDSLLKLAHILSDLTRVRTEPMN